MRGGRRAVIAACCHASLHSRHCHCQGTCAVYRLTTDSIASIATIAIVAFSNAAIATVVASVVVSSIGIVAIVVAPIAPVATNSNIASCQTCRDSVMKSHESVMTESVISCNEYATIEQENESGPKPASSAESQVQYIDLSRGNPLT